MTRRIFCKVLFVAVAVFGLLSFSGVLFAQGRSEYGLQRAKAAQERHTDVLMAKPGVVGTAVGLNDNGQHIVMVLLERSGVGGIPDKLDGVPVSSVVTGKFYALKPPTNGPPKPPRGLKATAFSENQIYLIILEWRDNREADVVYNVYRSTTSGSYGDPIASDVSVSQYIDPENPDDPGPDPGTTYYYVVTAKTSAGESAYSKEASATTTVGPPAAPSEIRATALSSSHIQLMWRHPAPEHVDYYNVYRSETKGQGYVAIGSTEVAYYQDSGLTPETTYYYVVTAANTAGESGYSPEASATTRPVVAPAAPSNLAPTAVTSSQIDLSWSDNAIDETGFKIERGIVPGPFVQIDTVGANVRSYSDTGLQASTEYAYRVCAYNEAGDSDYAGPIWVITEAAPEKPPLWC